MLDKRKQTKVKRLLDRLLNTTSQPICNDMEILDRILFESVDMEKTEQEKVFEFMDILILCGFDVCKMDVNLSSFIADKGE